MTNGFRQKKRRKAGPARNQHLGQGQVVTVADIKKHAFAGCQKGCRGSGLMPYQPGEQPRACECATRRFLKAHPNLVIDERANAWWPANCDQCGNPNTPGTDECSELCNAAGEIGRGGSPHETKDD